MTTDQISDRIEKAKALMRDAVDLLFPILGEENTARAIADAIDERLDYHVEEAAVVIAYPYSTMLH